MSTECYYSTCPNHSKTEPFCHEPDCVATDDELQRYCLERKLQRLGYDLEELELDNPYNGV